MCQGSLIDDFRTGYPLFKALTNNPTFVNRLLQRYAAHLGSTLYSNRMITILNQLSAERTAKCPVTSPAGRRKAAFRRWPRGSRHLDEIKTFAVARPAHAVSRLQTATGLEPWPGEARRDRVARRRRKLRIAGVPMTPQYNTTISLVQKHAGGNHRRSRARLCVHRLEQWQHQSHH